MATRDDFPKNVRLAVALRAGYRCSFDGCSALTVGPSEESNISVTRIGVASHIHAAAPGGKRYLETMTPDQRKNIENAVWMCASHGTLIDQDEVTYPASVIRTMKLRHEAAIAEMLRRGMTSVAHDLFAVGQSVVFAGEFLGSQGNVWKVRLDHFVAGDIGALVSLGDSFSEVPRRDRYLLVESFGDGRVLSEPLAWERQGGALLLTFTVDPRFPRTSAKDIGEDIKVDLKTRSIDYSLGTVAGVEALPQRIQLNLWHQRGQVWLADGYGTRIAEYFSLFGRTVWFSRLAKLEAIRMAAIPYYDELMDREDTPFGCVDKVVQLEVLDNEADTEWLPARIALEVVGVGTWSSEISLHVPPFPSEEPVFPSADDLLP